MNNMIVKLARPVGASDEELFTLGRRLAADLRAAGKVDARPATHSDSEPGTKTGTALDLGAVIVTGLFSAAALSAICDVLRVWISRRRAGDVTVIDGERRIVVRGLTEEQLGTELAELMSWLKDAQG